MPNITINNIIEIQKMLDKQHIPKPHFVLLPNNTPIHIVKAFFDADIEVINWTNNKKD